MLARRYRFSIARNGGGKMCVYFCDWGVFRFTNEEIRLYIARNVGRYFYAYSDEVVFLIVHNFFGGILGVSALRAKGYRFKAKPVCRFLFGGTASYRRVLVADVCILPLHN